MNKTKNIINEIKITFPSKSENEAVARISAAAACAPLDPCTSEIIDIKTAVSEAVTNCIVHAYRDNIGIIEITVRLLEGNICYIRIKDKGCGIDDVKKAMQPLFTTRPDEERAGLGFAVMESFMDSVRVYSKKGKGTSVILTKKISEKLQTIGSYDDEKHSEA